MIRSRLAALRAAARIARRDALRARGRTALIATLVALPVLVGTTGLVLLQSSYPTQQRWVESALGTEVEALIGPFEHAGLEQEPGADGFHATGARGTPPPVEEYEARLVELLPDDARLLRTSAADVTVQHGDQRLRSQRLVEVPREPALDLVHPVRSGRLPTSAHEVAVSTWTQRRLGIEVGDTISLGVPGAGNADASTDATISGILRNRLTYGPDVVALPGAFLPPVSLAGDEHRATSARVVGAPARPSWYVVGAPIGWDEVVAVNSLGSTVLSREIALGPTADSLAPTRPYVDGRAAAITAAVVAAILLEVVLLVGPAFAVGARRNQRLLALVAATGGDRRTLRDVVLLGGLVIGGLASLLGLVGGLGVAWAIQAGTAAAGSVTFPDLQVPTAVVLLVAVGTVVAVAAAWLPARRASRVDVAASLAGRRAEPRPRRRVPVIGVAVAAAGVAVAAAGAVLDRTVPLVAGVLTLELGLVAAVGGVLTLLAGLAPRMGVAGRFALRDAARQLGRTAPAVAAVLAAVAGAVATGVYLTSDSAYRAATYVGIGGPGAVAVVLGGWDVPLTAVDTDEREDSLRAAERVLRDELPVEEVHPVRALSVPAAPGLAADAYPGAVVVQVVRPPEHRCPTTTHPPTRAELRRLAADPRCTFHEWGWNGPWSAPDGSGDRALLVDDGTVLRTLGVEDAHLAAAALSAGRVVVRSELDLHPDGTVLLEVTRTAEGAVRESVHLPATAIPRAGDGYDVVLPPEAVEAMGGTSETVGLAVSTSRPIDLEEDHDASDVLADVAPTVWLQVERGPHAEGPLALWLLAAAAGVIAVAATAIAVALAAAESRPDLATLGAVGAAPLVRRRVAAAQAGVIAGTGVTLGVVTGLLLGWVFVLAARNQISWSSHARELVVPWDVVAATAVGLPVLTVAGAFLLSRSRLPRVERVAGW